MKRFVTYLRVSSSIQAEQGCSLAAMQARCEAYIAAQGGVMVRSYTDEAYSGTLPPARRPALAQLLRDMKEKVDFNVVLTFKFDRIARNARDLLNLDHEFRCAGVGLESVVELIDTRSPGGRVLFSVLGIFAEHEAVVGGIRCRNAMASLTGQFLGGRPPLGYKVEGKCLVVDGRTKPIVERIFQEFIKRKNMTTVATVMNEAGFVSSYGCQWSYKKIQRIITNPVYKGWAVFGRRVKKSRGWGGDLVEKPGVIEKIIDEKVFDRVQKCVAARRAIHQMSAQKSFNKADENQKV